MTINKTSFEKRIFIMKEVLETKKPRNLEAKENNLSCAKVGENELGPYKIKANKEKENEYLAQQIICIFEEPDHTFGVVRKHYALKREVKRKPILKNTATHGFVSEI